MHIGPSIHLPCLTGTASMVGAWLMSVMVCFSTVVDVIPSIESQSQNDLISSISASASINLIVFTIHSCTARRTVAVSFVALFATFGTVPQKCQSIAMRIVFNPMPMPNWCDICGWDILYLDCRKPSCEHHVTLMKFFACKVVQIFLCILSLDKVTHRLPFLPYTVLAMASMQLLQCQHPSRHIRSCHILQANPRILANTTTTYPCNGLPLL